MNIVTKEYVQSKRYSNNRVYIPTEGDIVRVKGIVGVTRVDSLGGCYNVFHNCTFGDKFCLTTPWMVELVQRANT